MNQLALLLARIIDIYIIIILVRAVLSWFAITPQSFLFSFYIFLIKLTEPVLGWVRAQMNRFAPNMMIDFSPVIVIVLLNLVRNFLLRF
ncbi:MAG TPA: YggT family protein [Candidatus Cloacimonadota bacterium]|nr:YggT family protein [Candidatus Cloacimonadota bacterium]